MTTLRQLKLSEEKKREAAWSPAERWRVIQETITWAEAQSTCLRGAPAQRKAEERARIASADKRRRGAASLAPGSS